MSIQFSKTVVSMAAALVLTAGSASAATITETFHLGANFWSSDYGNQGPSFSLTEGDLTATFSGHTFTSIATSGNTITSASGYDTDIARWSGGVGIQNSGADSHQVDGFVKDDYVAMSFDKEVSLEKVDFTYFREDSVERQCTWSWRRGWLCDRVHVDRDDFRWMFDSTGDNEIGVGDFISDNISSDPYSAFPAVKSNLFAVGAFDGNDDWKLKKVKVSYMTPVPLPASAVLLLAGLGGLGLMGRKRSN